AFAIHEINKDAEPLLNATLGSKIYMNAFSSWLTSQNILAALFSRQLLSVNYNCAQEDKLMAVIGGLTSPNSIQMLGYGSFDPVLRDKTLFPSFYQMVPNEEPQYVGIVQLLKHFGWNWIGLVLSNDDSGETFLRILRPRLLQSDICIAWELMSPPVTRFLPREILKERLRSFQSTLLLKETNVILIYGESNSLDGFRIFIFMSEILDMHPVERVWITTAEWDYTAVSVRDQFTAKSFNGTLSFNLHTNVQFWFSAFACSFPQYKLYEGNKENCTGEEKLESLPGPTFEMDMSGQSYNIYNAVHAVAHALLAMNLEKGKLKLHSFLRSIHFNNSAGEEIFFDDKGDLPGGYNLINLSSFLLKPTSFRMREPLEEGFHTMPRSTCVESCHPGQSKFVQQGEPVCCYDCIQCPKGEISNADQCEVCPDDQYPNSNHDRCIAKEITYLSYAEPLGIALAFLALVLCGICCTAEKHDFAS
uniref:G-protein coupled receptors family 3 profile domain-containing protein n=1 Tax=Varanus komodoensis TaxID=61221 RepID=A0A8D2LNS2_VARKO